MTAKIHGAGLSLRAQLSLHPGDHELRGIYADWLEENGFLEEARGQRRRLDYRDGASTLFLPNEIWTEKEA